MNENTFAITMKEVNLDGYDYDYRLDLPDGLTIGYVRRDRFGGCELYHGDTPYAAYANNELMLYGDTPSNIKDTLEFELNYKKG